MILISFLAVLFISSLISHLISDISLLSSRNCTVPENSPLSECMATCPEGGSCECVEGRCFQCDSGMTLQYDDGDSMGFGIGIGKGD